MKKLEWDSDFWGVNIYEVELDECLNSIPKLDDDHFLIQSKLEISNNDDINKLEKIGFYLKDLEIEYTKSLIPCTFDSDVKSVFINDLDFIEPVIEPLVQNSRFLIFNKPRVLKFYKTWVLNSINGKFDDECFCIKNNGNVAGLITYKKLSNKNARVGLISVKGEYQKKGVGKKLLDYVEAKLYEDGVENLRICTQGQNIRANNFYIKNGYKINNIKAIMYYRDKGVHNDTV